MNGFDESSKLLSAVKEAVVLFGSLPRSFLQMITLLRYVCSSDD